MENNEQNIVLEEKQESKLTFWKVVLIIFLVFIILLGVFWVLCWWTFIWILSLIWFWESHINLLALIIPTITAIIAFYLSYLIIKYWIRWIKNVKSK